MVIESVSGVVYVKWCRDGKGLKDMNISYESWEREKRSVLSQPKKISCAQKLGRKRAFAMSAMGISKTHVLSRGVLLVTRLYKASNWQFVPTFMGYPSTRPSFYSCPLCVACQRHEYIN